MKEAVAAIVVVLMITNIPFECRRTAKPRRIRTIAMGVRG